MRLSASCSILALLVLAAASQAATIAKPFTFSPGTTISSSQVNSNFDTIFNDYNGNINANNLAANAVGTSQLQNAAVTTAKIATANVTYALIQSMLHSTLLGNPTALTAVPSEITLIPPLDFAGTTLTTTETSGTFPGRTTAGKGALEEVTPATYHFAFANKQLLLATNSVTTDIIAVNAVAFADMQQLPTKTIIGNSTSGTANAQAVTPATYNFGMQNSQLFLTTGSVTADDLGTGAVTTAKIGSGAVTIATMDSGAMGTPGLVDTLNVSGGVASTTTVSVICQNLAMQDSASVIDAKWYRFKNVAFTLTPVSGALGLLGQDTTFAAATATLYYCYAIGKTDLSAFSGVVSNLPPSSGPNLGNAAFTGYTLWRLVSAFRNNANGSYAIRKFYQQGAHNRMTNIFEHKLVDVSASSATPDNVTLAGIYPAAIASTMDLHITMTADASAANGFDTLDIWQDSGGTVDSAQWTCNSASGVRTKMVGDAIGFHNFASGQTPLYYTYIKTTNGSPSAQIYFTGFTIDSLAR